MIICPLFFQWVVPCGRLPHWRFPLPTTNCWSQRDGAIPKLCFLGGGWQPDSGKPCVVDKWRHEKLARVTFFEIPNKLYPLLQDGCDFVCRSQNREEAPAYRGVATEHLEEEPEERDDHLLPMWPWNVRNGTEMFTVWHSLLFHRLDEVAVTHKSCFSCAGLG